MAAIFYLIPNLYVLAPIVGKDLVQNLVLGFVFEAIEGLINRDSF